MNSPCVHKFGGSSLANASCFHRVANIVKDNNQVIVVSAVAGVTDQLQKLLDTAEKDKNYKALIDDLLNTHETIISQLNLQNAKPLRILLNKDISNITDILNTVRLTNSFSSQVRDLILSYGEIWSANILTALLNEHYDAEFLDAAHLIFVKEKQSVIQVDWHKSQTAWDKLITNKTCSHLVITGFIASNEHAKRTTLGRNGSDFSATIVAALADAKELTIWTDVDGVYSADPRRVPKAFILERISYQEILELSYFGAKVLHSQSVAPAVENEIKIHIKNTFNPAARGTTISIETEENDYLVRGVSSINEVALINVEGPGLVGVSGIAARLFAALSSASVSVILISQASSEHSICIAVRSKDVSLAKDVIEQAFILEINACLMDALRIDNDCAIIAAVGEGMIGTPGITARLGQALAQANISIKALAQGSSERNISAVIAREDINKALRVVHSGFYLSGKSISIGLIGPGLIGKELLRQIKHAKQKLKQDFNVNLSVRGIMNSKNMLLHEHQTTLEDWENLSEQNFQKSDVSKFVEHVVADDIPHTVILDCSASEMVASQYLKFLKNNIHVITPNKRANSGDLTLYRELMDMTRDGNHHYLYETTVCAGLPVIKTLQDMIRSGDEVFKIEGIVSGTLAYIFNALKTGKSFSKIVLEAREQGFTEPDPRDDLSGTDVARKMVVLAREIGLAINLEDVNVHNLVPEGLQDCSVEEFLQGLPKYDKAIEEQLQQLVKKGETACYVGIIRKEGDIDVKIGSYAASHPFSHLRGTDNILAFHTKRYSSQPLVVQGPGAGAEVTAAGVFSDLLRLVSFLD